MAADPSAPERMYLGTRTGQVYVSQDGGKSWSRLISFQAPSQWVVDTLLIDPADPNVVYAGLWSLQGETGGIFRSTDRGLTWSELEGMKGQSVRNIAIAPSSSKILVAGSLRGVFRSEDAGASWTRISPAGHPEIRNIHGLAIDPVNPQIIYAGTWHLPWKTVDGGAHWFSIKSGMIDDSDIFSIVIDPHHSQTLYASACSGIFRSDNGGEQWRKVQGIPYSSRRTRVLTMDTRNSATVYAGTTEGLWRTKNGGANWTLLTDHAWVINAIVIDPRESRHVYLGMDQSGVVESRDEGASFQMANSGFAQRQISSLVADPVRKGRFYAALVADGQFGSVLVTDDNGASWRNTGPGLDRRDVLSLLVVTQPSWKLFAGTSDGIFEYSPEQSRWQNQNQVQLRPGSFVPSRGVSVWQLYRRDDSEAIYAASSAGLLVSRGGASWTPLPLVASGSGVSAVATGGESGKIILAATSAGLRISRDFGQSWQEISVDGDAQFRGQKIASDRSRPNVFFVAGNTGLYRSTDGGLTWEKFGHGLPYSTVREVLVSPGNPSNVTVASSAGVFQSTDGGAHYSRIEESAAMQNLPIQLLALHPLSSLPILAGSAYNGLFQYDGAEPAQPALASAIRDR